MKFVTGLGVALLAVGFSACGTSSKAAVPTTRPVDSASTTAPPATTNRPRTVPTRVAMSKAEYITRANAFCQTMNNQLHALPDPGSDNLKAAEETDRAAAITGATLRRLRGLVTPPGDGPVVAAIYQKVDAIVADSATLSTVLRSGNNASINAALSKVKADSTAANAASNAYGMSVCGSS